MWSYCTVETVDWRPGNSAVPEKEFWAPLTVYVWTCSCTGFFTGLHVKQVGITPPVQRSNPHAMDDDYDSVSIIRYPRGPPDGRQARTALEERVPVRQQEVCEFDNFRTEIRNSISQK